jgi:hypothetical protein
MCLILDANCLHKVFPSTDKEFLPIKNAITAGGAKLVYGGTKLLVEYKKVATAWRMIVALDRAGRTRKVNDSEVDAIESKLKAAGQLQSDDPHVIALASVSGVRLLCSHDQDLHADFTNPNFLQPRGSVYQNANHKHLIRQHCGS